MPSLFHFVPRRMVGSVLYPLNVLKDREPEAWHREVAKYEGREHVLDTPIPPLGCLWNDVLHFSTVHPSLVAAELEAAGFEPSMPKFFMVDAEALDPERTVIFLNQQSEVQAPIDESQWLPFAPVNLVDQTQMNEPTRRYYRESAARGQHPLLYAYLPHVLFRGHLEISGWQVYEV